MRAEKQLLLDEIKERLEQADSFVVLNYKNLKSNVANNFRRTFSEAGGDLEVVRKRVFLKAAKEAGITFDSSILQGSIAIAFGGKESIETTKAIFKWRKENPDLIDVLVGMFDGNIYDASSVERLSKLPSLDQMRAQFLGLLEAPMGQTLSVMNSLLTSVIYCLENKAKAE